MRRSLDIDTDAVVVEDHTHDPLAACAYASNADYAVASLRKTLPLPDGGVLWSPKDKDLPRERPVTPRHLQVAMNRLSAMALKLHYLSGCAVDKAEFRARFAEGERAIGAGAISGISAFSRQRLRSLPARRWQEVRADNLAQIRREIDAVPGFQLLDTPFAATLVFSSAQLRDRVRSALIVERIYPAVLWPLEEPDGTPAEQVELSRRLLTIHCDFRYSRKDMSRVAAQIAALCCNDSERQPEITGKSSSSAL
jgi:hypothetical protein